MIAFAYPIVTVIAGYGSGKDNLTLMSYTLMTLALGIVPFTIQYFQLRTFYAFEDTRTPFFLQCVIAATNIAAAVIGVRVILDAAHLRFSGVVLGAAYALAYLVAVLMSRPVLRRKVPRVPGAGIGLPLLAMVIAAVLGVGRRPRASLAARPGRRLVRTDRRRAPTRRRGRRDAAGVRRGGAGTPHPRGQRRGVHGHIGNCPAAAEPGRLCTRAPLVGSGGH